jgi:hypothetical protein
MLCYALSPVANSRYAGLAAILALIATSSVTALIRHKGDARQEP